MTGKWKYPIPEKAGQSKAKQDEKVCGVPTSNRFDILSLDISNPEIELGKVIQMEII